MQEHNPCWDLVRSAKGQTSVFIIINRSILSWFFHLIRQGGALGAFIFLCVILAERGSGQAKKGSEGPSSSAGFWDAPFLEFNHGALKPTQKTTEGFNWSNSFHSRVLISPSTLCSFPFTSLLGRSSGLHCFPLLPPPQLSSVYI